MFDERKIRRVSNPAPISLETRLGLKSTALSGLG